MKKDPPDITDPHRFSRWKVTRRVFLKTTLLGAAGICFRIPHGYGSNRPLVRFGIVTDSHYADIKPQGTRFYRESVQKMRECISLMNEKEVDFIIHLGDFINGAPSGNMENLRRLAAIYGTFNGPRYHVLGNHDTDRISKTQFLSIAENTGIAKNRTYYSFDRNGVHVVVLDANFRQDGEPYNSGNYHWTDANIPPEQLDWLETDLKKTTSPTIVCVHQLLDGDEGNHYTGNAPEVRSILEQAPNVCAVFQGHQHNGQYNLIHGIHYYTLKAMVENPGEENNSYAIAEVFEDRNILITGFRKAVSREMQL